MSTTTALTDFARETESHLQALIRAAEEGYRIDKAQDPTEGYREGLTAQQAASVAAIDPSLISLRRWTCAGCGDTTAEPVWAEGTCWCYGCRESEAAAG